MGKVRKSRRAKTDPELQRQLDSAKESGEPVEAVLTLRRLDAGRSDVASTVDEVVRRVESSLGSPATDYNVLGNLGIVVMAAPERVVNAFLDQPEIESAAANEVASD